MLGKTIQTHSLKDVADVAREFVQGLRPEVSGALVIGLNGDLGSGKTTFTQAVAKALGVAETVTSPTFVLEKVYKLQDQLFTHLIHIDAYRLEDGSELDVLGWKDMVENAENLILIEWPERVADVMPVTTKHIHFKFIDETTREILF